MSSLFNPPAVQAAASTKRASFAFAFVALLAIMLMSLPASAQDTAEADREGFPAQFYAPYVYPGAFPLGYLKELTGVPYFTLAFILSGSDPCTPTWPNGLPVLRESQVTTYIDALREAGGDVIPSFGGAGGTELARSCEDVETLTAQYQAVVEHLDVRWLDFDVEGVSLRETESVDRRNQALATLQDWAEAEGRALEIAYTLPVAPFGLTEDGLNLLRSALEHGLDVSLVNVMTMNYGEDDPPDQMGTLTIQAAESLHAQLSELYPDLSSEEVWARIGLTPMIGLNDVRPQVFTLDDAELITDFVIENGIRLTAMWSVGRDKSCSTNMALVSDTCSGIVQEDFAFSTIFNRINAPEA
ncbi:MAG: chitinase [Anaerolineae bacterium]|nr:chitinase [Anaerolineae bacterium]